MDLFLGACSKTIWQYLQPVAGLTKLAAVFNILEYPDKEVCHATRSESDSRGL